jgi:hypothetical protein
MSTWKHYKPCLSIKTRQNANNTQVLQQLLVLLAEQQAQAQQPKNKVIEITAPSGKVYTGQVSE